MLSVPQPHGLRLDFRLLSSYSLHPPVVLVREEMWKPVQQLVSDFKTTSTSSYSGFASPKPSQKGSVVLSLCMGFQILSDSQKLPAGNLSFWG